MWTYSQRTGAITHPNGEIIVHGYSGGGEGKNDPSMERVQGVGPIPRGKWKIIDLKLGTMNHGPFVLVLKPLGPTYGRSAFLIHGDSIAKPGTASRGCIIASRPAREIIWNSGDRDLLVVE